MILKVFKDIKDIGTLKRTIDSLKLCSVELSGTDFDSHIANSASFNIEVSNVKNSITFFKKIFGDENPINLSSERKLEEIYYGNEVSDEISWSDIEDNFNSYNIVVTVKEEYVPNCLVKLSLQHVKGGVEGWIEESGWVWCLMQPTSFETNTFNFNDACLMVEEHFLSEEK